MKVPESLTSDLPPSVWGKILGATPVVLTVVATVLAGLASSEMTGAQYDRSLGAQLQAKAGDQWNFFQGQKLRGAMQRNLLDLLASAGALRPVTAATLPAGLAGTPAAEALTAGRLPEAGTAATLPPAVQAAVDALESAGGEAEVLPAIGRASAADVQAALRAAQQRADDFDARLSRISQSIAAAEPVLAAPATDAGLRRDFIAARVGFEARRYEAEAQLSQGIARLYELEVRKSNVSAERHHLRSANFFYGMLAAQMGVVISTLAMAARKRSLLWLLAAGAGLAAVAFAVYVYLCI
jgi:hypothetical protein